MSMCYNRMSDGQRGWTGINYFFTYKKYGYRVELKKCFFYLVCNYFLRKLIWFHVSGVCGIGQGEGTALMIFIVPLGLLPHTEQEGQEIAHGAEPCCNAMNLNIATLLHVFNRII